MNASLVLPLFRVVAFWYLVVALVFFLGDPNWAESSYSLLSWYPGVPQIKMQGLATAAQVQWALVVYWTVPLLFLGLLSVGLSVVGGHVIRARNHLLRKARLAPRGSFCSVSVPAYTVGILPVATTPVLTGKSVVLPDHEGNGGTGVVLRGRVLEVITWLTPEERVLCEELIQLLAAYPHHFAGHGHGVGLLEHTLNVVAEVADKCTAEFRLPVIAALAHDIGKLISFVPTSNGEWRRQGLHSREGARILATLPSFPLLPEDYRNALLLAVKYGHAPNKIPSLRGDTKASMLALRVIAAMSQADRSATAGEKDRNLVKLQPEDLLWQDFVDFLREAPIVQRGKMGAANQVNNPPGSPYLYIYEAPWRDAAMHRMPAEVAAALDLTRRDAGKLAKYTRILAARLRKDGLLVEEYEGASVSEANPLWDIQSGTGEKSLVLRGVLVLRAEKLLRLVNYRLSATSPYPVQLLAPNASVGGVVNKAPDRKKEAPTPEVSDSIRLSPLSDTATLIQVGVSDAPASTVDSATAPEAAPPHAPKVRSKFKNPEADAAMGLTPATGTPLTEKPQPGLQVDPEHAKVTDTEADPPKTAMELLAAVTPTEAPQPKSENLPPAIEAHGSAGTPIEVLPSAPPGESTPTPSGVPATKVIDSENQGLAPGTKLSRVEEQEGLAIADDKACLLYPKLVIGDKYYTAQSRSVRVGATSPGGRYKGGDKLKQLDSQAPRRSKKRF